jgi:hypothetical protein
MHASPDDARLLFGKWHEESTPVWIKYSTPVLFFRGIGVVAAITPDAIQISGEVWTYTVFLDGVTYSFSDPREIPVAVVREMESAKYELGLALHLPNGDDFVLLEMKPRAEPPAEEENE